MSDNTQDGITERDHKRVADYVMEVAGIQLPASKRYLIEGRLRKRQRILGHPKLKTYIDHVLKSDEGSSERIHLIDAMTTNKTDFFREPDHFRYIEQNIIPQLANDKQTGWQRPLRIWSAGCSTGEEPYTLAMVLNEVKRKYSGLRFEITATDLSPSVLNTAKRAIYAHNRVDPVPMDLRHRYLLKNKNKTEDLIRIAPEIRSQISFGSFNLLKDEFSFPHQFDLIFCRNVMIYFTLEDRMSLINNFTRALDQQGYLFIGHAESLSEQKNLQQVIPTIYQKIT